MSTIDDGRTGRTASVDENNRLNTLAVTKKGPVDSALNGDTFFISSGAVELTSDSESYLLYIENTDDKDWIVDSIVATFGASDGVGDSFNKIIIGPTSGTLLTAGANGFPANVNLGSAHTLPSVVKVGSEASTATGGAPPINSLIPAGVPFRVFAVGPIIIAPSTSLAVGYQPPVGNTSMNYAIQLTVYKEVS